MTSTTRRPSVVVFLLAACILAAIFWYFAIRTIANNRIYRIPSASMLPTLELNDKILVEKDAYRDSPPKFGDLVMFKAPPQALFPGQHDVEYCKRCMGEAGDVIEIRGGKLFRNGKETPEPYVRAPMERSLNFRLIEFKGRIIPLQVGPLGANTMDSGVAEEFMFVSAQEEQLAMKQRAAAIPTGKLLMMGDNRDNSSDGRMWGLIDVSAVVGKATKL